MKFFLIGLAAFLFTVFAALLVRKIYPRLGLMDKPEKYGHKREPIPYSAGLAFIVVFIAMSIFLVPIDQKFVSVLIGAFIIVIMSFLDDRKGISPWIRLLIQLVAVLIPILFGGVLIENIHVPLSGSDFNLNLFLIGSVSIIAVLITVFWLLYMINTMNWIDGLNGLPSGVSAIAALTFFFLSIKDFHTESQEVLAVLSIILAGAMLAFWIFDFYPAKMLMGDTGSMFLGYILGIFAIYNGAKIGTAILVMGFPLLDTVWTVSRRIFSGKSPFKGDLFHFHHRLLYAGLSQRQALLVIYVLSAIFGLMAVTLNSVFKFWALIALVLLMAVLGLWVSIKGER